MNNKITILISLLLLICFTLPPFSILASNLPVDEHLNIATLNSRPISVDRLVYTAFKDMGIDTSFIAMSAESGIDSALHNEDYGVILTVRDPDITAPDLVKIPVALNETYIYALARQDSQLHIREWSDLSNLHVGIASQYAFVQESLPQNVKLTVRSSNDVVMEALSNGEYDVAIIAHNTKEKFAIKSGIVYAGQLSSYSDYLYINKKHSTLAHALTSALANVLTDGRGQDILNYVSVSEPDTPKTILHIVSSNTEVAREEQFLSSLREDFVNDDSIEWYNIAFNARRFSLDANRLMYFAQLLRQDFISRNVSAIIVSGDTALEFLREYYYLLFYNVPILFYGVSEDYGTLVKDFETYTTGIVEHVSAYETVSAALHLFPDTKNIYVVNDYTTEGMRYREAIESQLKSFDDINIVYNENLELNKLMSKLRSLPSDSFVLMGSYFRDASGQYYSQNQLKRGLEGNCNVPVFTVYSTALGYNAIGGKCVDYEAYGNHIAEAVKQIQNGSDLSEIPVINSAGLNRWVFDMNAMTAFGVRTNALPANSQILNKTLSVWESNPRFAYFMTLALTTIICAATIFHIYGKQKEHLRNARELLLKDEKLNKIKERLETIINTSPVAFVMSVDGLVVDANELIKESVGVKIGSDISQYYTDPGMQEHLVRRAKQREFIENEIISFNMANGETHRFLANFTTIELDGENAYALWGMDIEDRERQKDDLQASRQKITEVSERFNRIISSAPFIFLIYIDGIVVEANANAKNLTGVQIGKHILEIYTDAIEHDIITSRVSENGILQNELIQFKFADGEIHRCLVNLVTTDYGGQTATVVWAVDVEEMEQQKDQLDAAQRNLRTIVDTMPIPIGIADSEDMWHVYGNNAYIHMFEMDLHFSLYERTVADAFAVAQKDGSTAEELTHSLASSDSPLVKEVQIRTLSGKILDVRLHTSPITYEGRRAVIGIFIDLSAEKEYQLMQESLQTLLNTLPMAVSLVDAESSLLVYANDTYHDLLRYDREANIIGSHASLFMPSLQRDGTPSVNKLVSIITSDHPDGIDADYLTADGMIIEGRVISRLIGYQGKETSLEIIQDYAEIKELERTRQSLQTILDTMPTPISIVDDETMRIVYGNNSYLRLHEFDTLNDLYGTPVYYTLAVTQGNGLSAVELCDNVIGSSDSHILEIQSYTAKGHTIDLRIITSPISYRGKRCTIGVMTDLTAEKAHERMLLTAAEKEKEANQLKSRFLVNMSHEIRTPMNAIIGLTEIELRKDENKSALEIYKKINSSAKNLLTIINDILDLSKIEADKIELFIDEFELSDVISSALLVAAPRLEGKNVEFMLNSSLDLPRYLMGDRTRLWQILKNFLDNAAKYTDNGKIVLNVSVDEKRSDANTVCIAFTIEDTGIGIDEEQLKKLFMPYTQIYNEAQKRYTGTGLGMAISKQLCELMGGTVHVRSRLGEGTSVYIDIPFKRSANRETELQSLEYPELEDINVLIVDDDEMSLSIMQRLLNRAGINCYCANNGEDALNMIYKQRDNGKYFDLILLDYMMDGMNGLETAKKIQTSLSRAPKLLMVTAHQHLLLKRELNYNNINEVIEKPFIPSQFISKILRSLGHEQSVGDSETFSITRFEDVHVLLCEDYSLNYEVATGMLAQFGITVTIAENGQEGIDALHSGKTFDLIFMDLQMPVMNGYEATRAIRRDSRFDDIPIISLTADAMTEVVGKCREAGMDDHLAKPIEFESLQKILVKWLPQSKQSSDAPTVAQEDLSPGLARFGGNRDLYEKSLLKFSKDIPDVWPDFEHAITDTNTAPFIHKIKGAAGNLSENEIYEIATSFEKTMRAGAPDKELYSRLMNACADFKSRIQPEPEQPQIADTGSREEFEENFEALFNALTDFDLKRSSKALESLKAKEWPFVDHAKLDELYETMQSYDYLSALDLLESMRIGK